MMETIAVLRLNTNQFHQLIMYCAAYRGFLWQNVHPSPARNQAIRSIQAFQGRLEKAQEQERAEIALPLIAEEKSIIKQLFSGLTQFYGVMQPSEQRTRQLNELTGLRLQIERTLRQTQAL